MGEEEKGRKIGEREEGKENRKNFAERGGGRIGVCLVLKSLSLSLSTPPADHVSDSCQQVECILIMREELSRLSKAIIVFRNLTLSLSLFLCILSAAYYRLKGI